MSRNTRATTLEKPPVFKYFDDEISIIGNGFKRFEFIPISGEKYKLSVILEENLYTGEVEIGYQASEWIDTSDLLKVFSGVPNLDEHTSLSFETVVQDQILKISVTISFQKDRKKKRSYEQYEFELSLTERDIEQEDTNAIKKYVEKLEQERELLTKNLLILEGFFDNRIQALDLKFYFHVTQKTNTDFSQISIKISQDNKDFTKFIHEHPRFRAISGHFKKNIHETKIHFHSMELYEKNHRNIQEWIIDTNLPAEIGYSFTHRTPEMMIEYIKKRDHADYFDQRKQVDTILLTLFECNLEFELYGKILLPPIICYPQIQYIESRGNLYSFDIISQLSNLPKFEDETFFHPSIGFYKSDIERCFD